MSNNTDKIIYRVPNGLKIIGYGLDNRGDRIPAQVKSVSSLKSPRTASCAISTGIILSRRVKLLEYEADKSAPSNADVKNEWSCTSALNTCLHVCRGASLPLRYFLQVKFGSKPQEKRHATVRAGCKYLFNIKLEISHLLQY